MSCLFATSSFAAEEETTFTVSISGLRNLERNLEEMKDKGLATWLADHAKSKAKASFPSLFEDEAGARKAVQAGEHKLSIQKKGVEAYRRGVEESDRTAGDVFYSWLQSDKLPDMNRDLLPEGVQKALGKWDKAVANAEYLADKAETAWDRAQSFAAEYFPDDMAAGLEPESPAAVRAGRVRDEGEVEIGPSPQLVEDVQEYYVAEQEEELQARAERDAYATAESLEEEFRDSYWDGEEEESRAPQAEANPYADDISWLEESVGGGSGKASDYSDDLDYLESTFEEGVGSGSNYGDDAEFLEEGLAHWDAEKEREELERRRQEEARRRLEAKRRAEEAERQRLAAARAERRRAREAREQALAQERSRERGSGWGSVLGEVLGGVAVQILEDEYGVSVPMPGSVPSGGNGYGDVGGDSCAQANSTATAIVNRCQSQVQSAQGICATYDVLIRCLDQGLSSSDVRGCPTIFNALKQQRAEVVSSRSSSSACR